MTNKNNLILNFNLGAIALGFFLSLTACNGKKVQVAKLPPTPVQVKTYSKASLQENPISLNDNTAFLWKTEGELKDQVKEVQLLSGEIDRLNKEMKELEAPLTSISAAMDAELSHFDDTQKQQWSNFRTIEERTQKALNTNTQKLNRENQALVTEYQNFENFVVQIDNQQKALDEEKAKNPPNQEAIDNLEKSIADLNKQKTSSLEKIKSLKNNISTFSDKIAKANDDLNKIQSDKEGIYKNIYNLALQHDAEEKRIAPLKEAISNETNEKITKLRENVDPIESPSKLDLSAANDQILLKLDWVIDPNCTDCSNSFSSENGTIKNLTYNEVGGVLDFELTHAQNLYTIHLVRTETKEGLISYSGDLTILYADQKTRKGVLKLLNGK